jgi:hypothetical protein
MTKRGQTRIAAEPEIGGPSRLSLSVPPARDVNPIENDSVDYKDGQNHGPDNESGNKKENVRQSNARHGLASVFDVNEEHESEVPEMLVRRLRLNSSSTHATRTSHEIKI